MICESILLLDLSVVPDLGDGLYRALTDALDSNVRVQRESLGGFDGPLLGSEIECIVKRQQPDLVCLVVAADDADLVESLLAQFPVPVIVATDLTASARLLGLLQHGASDFISPPFRAHEIMPRIGRLMAQVEREKTLKQALKRKLGLSQLIGQSPGFCAEVDRIPQVANCDATVLIQGETGTGKELFGRAIHYLGPRAARPFVPINCGAIPAELVENELFGHERGAYTSASTTRPGLVSEAEGGTLFLDEIDCLPLPAQVKLLRLLQEKEYRALGSNRLQRADLRVVAASNGDLLSAVDQGRMRRDLYYRLNILPFNLPPLRERREDVPLLANCFLAKYSAGLSKRLDGVSSEAMQSLIAYDWPGNVRELENIIERAAVLSDGPVISVTDVMLPQSPADAGGSFREAKAKLIGQFETSYIRGLLAANNGNVSRAARAAGKNRRAFFELIRKHNINVESIKFSS